MQAVGVVAEYNPFHNGHRYHLQQARAVTGADVVIAVMSGNFVQRGEAAIFNKWQRASEALHNGADLVVELPFHWAVQPAHLFAQGALSLLSAMQVPTLVFGAEHYQTDFAALAHATVNDSQAFKTFNETYATLFNAQLESQTGFRLDQPNDILGYGYAVANAKLSSPLKLMPVARVGSEYHDDQMNPRGYSSATAIRQTVLGHQRGVNVAANVPAETFADIRHLTPLKGWSPKMWALLRHTLLMMPTTSLHQIYQMSEGLDYRLKEAAETQSHWDDFLTAIKTKRYTYSRLQRVCLYALVHALDNEMTPGQTDYLRLLGFTSAGQHYLNAHKKTFGLPVVTRFDQNLKKTTLNLDYRAGMLYEMLTGQSQDFRHDPIRIGTK
ncbi:nucleotidyltransferase [Furfurilactobacillus cerevisiae]|uniref:nucleotidyltransferase n=1 Tax=Furfurilactobacillus rossiae TaxID=231049 RepID=UPI003B986A41